MKLLLSLFFLFLGLNSHSKGGLESETCKPDVFLDADFIADQLSCQQKEIPLNYHPRVFGFIDYFINRNREYTQMVINRSTAYFPLFEKELLKNDLPIDLKYLAIVESGLNPRAISKAGAAGLWQFMPSTGRMFGLNRDELIDDRLDPFASTEAAAKYLKSLFKQFGNWELALAAYNCGPGKIRRAIRLSGYKHDFWEIYPYLPNETRNYLPQFVAFAFIMENRHGLGFSDSEMEVYPPFKTITFTQNLDLDLLSKELNGCYEDFIFLNPQVKSGLVPIQRKDFALRIPLQFNFVFEESRDSILAKSSILDVAQTYQVATFDRTSTYGKQKYVYRVRSGDVLGTIAEKYKVGVGDIKKWNNLNGNVIKIGQNLSIWKAPGFQEKALVSSKSVSQPVPGSKIHVVKYGDTLWDISKMYEGLSIEKIKALNNLKTSRIMPGQRLRVG